MARKARADGICVTWFMARTIRGWDDAVKGVRRKTVSFCKLTAPFGSQLDLQSGLASGFRATEIFDNLGELGPMRALVAVGGANERVGFAVGVPCSK